MNRDEIDLTRILRRLEKTVDGQNWEGNDIWIKALETLQTVKFAKKLLKNVELYGVSEQDSERYEEMRAKLDRFEKFLNSVEQRSAPKRTRPKSLLSSLPKPKPILALDAEPSSAAPEEPIEPALPTDHLLTSPDDPFTLPSASPVPALISPLIPPATKSTTTAVTSGAFLENSKARQEAMTEQLAQMAVQLRKNAQHFSTSLAEDKTVIEETQTKLESNFGTMQKERIRLRDHRGKSGSTTCLVIFAIVGVLVTFTFMVALIRLTRR
ncbi:hypothetical protein GYMLUDRAFT_48560 [Collybiopsis luxurians FD-317 M1]|uniref:Vesicle transport protein USE1 n=1 Tax=Collybiopsis luxurians FD-317 M1 TaxID=944289 RepID=A0A0D0CI68_9AGAR|nr:hypothetical protein GYMLUDRAFT_48560 [Collybiopsis luxurians FD-317 M1]